MALLDGPGFTPIQQCGEDDGTVDFDLVLHYYFSSDANIAVQPAESGTCLGQSCVHYILVIYIHVLVTYIHVLIIYIHVLVIFRSRSFNWHAP